MELAVLLQKLMSAKVTYNLISLGFCIGFVVTKINLLVLIFVINPSLFSPCFTATSLKV